VDNERPGLTVVGDTGRSGEATPDGGDVFSARELVYITARAEGKTIKAAAAAADPPFSYSSARRLDDREDVRHALRQRAREAVEDGVRTLAQSASAAARALKRIAIKGGPGDGPSVSAARAILEISHKGIELDAVQEQLDAIKAQLAANGQPNSFRRS
jgi:hypothetical protein